MSGGAAAGRPPDRADSWRPWCLAAAALVALGALVPPVFTAARDADYAAALQFALLAIVVPALVTVGAPWRSQRLSGSTAGTSLASSDSPERLVDRVAEGRRRHRDLPRSLAFIALDLAVVVAWHSPAAVGAVARHGWPALLEAITLLVFGVGLWLELVRSPPFMPRSGHLRRAVLAAIVMWAFWILAYILGLSNHAFYPNFTHVPGGLSAAADQQIASAVSWFIATVAFVPVIFWNAVMWLKTEDDPDTELMALIRAERRRGTPLGGGGDGTPSP